MTLLNESTVIRYGISAAGTLISNQEKSSNLYLSCNADNDDGFINEVLQSELYKKYKKYTVTKVDAIRQQKWDVFPDKVLDVANPTHCNIDCGKKLDIKSAQLLSGCFSQETNPYWGGKVIA